MTDNDPYVVDTVVGPVRVTPEGVARLWEEIHNERDTCSVRVNDYKCECAATHKIVMICAKCRDVTVEQLCPGHVAYIEKIYNDPEADATHNECGGLFTYDIEPLP